MLIEIPDNLREYLNNLSNQFSDEVLALNTIFDSMIKNHHIIYASVDMLELLSVNKCLNHTNKYYIKWILDRRVDLYSGIAGIKTRIIITNENIVHRDNNMFYVPLKFCKDLKETMFLAEHETDAEFFTKCFELVSKYNKNSVYSLSIENSSCHGSNIGSKMEQVAKTGRIAVCILDSDKKYPDGEYGGTYKGALKVYKKLRDGNILGLEVLEVHEKENLLLPKSYLIFNYEQSVRKLLLVLEDFVPENDVYAFFDIKSGIKCKRLDEYRWMENFDQLITRLEKEEVIDVNSNLEPDDYLVKGVGDKKCSEAIKNCESIESLQMPDYLLKEWERIYNILLDWGCAVSSEYRPVYVV